MLVTPPEPIDRRYITSFVAFVGRGVADGLVVAEGVSLGRGAATCALHAASKKANASTMMRLGRIFITLDTTASVSRFPEVRPP
jgi:hypothetical protein